VLVPEPELVEVAGELVDCELVVVVGELDATRRVPFDSAGSCPEASVTAISSQTATNSATATAITRLRINRVRSNLMAPSIPGPRSSRMREA
jgi:hypothetical protein